MNVALITRLDCNILPVPSHACGLPLQLLRLPMLLLFLRPALLSLLCSLQRPGEHQDLAAESTVLKHSNETRLPA